MKDWKLKKNKKETLLKELSMRWNMAAWIQRREKKKKKMHIVMEWGQMCYWYKEMIYWNMLIILFFSFFFLCFSFAGETEKHLCPADSEVHSGSVLGILCDMCVGEEHAGYISAHSTVKLEIVWQPTIPGPAETDFLITFSDTLSQPVSNMYACGIS